MAHKIRFRIITDDVKIIDIDRDMKAVVGSASQAEMKSLVLSVLLSGLIGKAVMKGIIHLVMRNNPYLWEYLEEVRTKFDDKGIL